MKIQILMIIFIVSLSSCDAPQRSRSVNALTGNVTNTQGSNADNTLIPIDQGDLENSGGSNQNSGFAGCSNTNQYFLTGNGHIGLCQSSMDETFFKMTFTYPNPNSSNRTCFIPTYRDNSGNSTYLGQPQCTTHTLNQVIFGNLYKTRPGFTQYPINGVMVIREISVTAYFNCMNAYANFNSPQCPYGAQTGGFCQSQAQIYMQNLCSQFQAQHPFVDIQLN